MDNSIGDSTSINASASAARDFTNKPQHLLAIVVVGASGDLAKRKTYPSLFRLFRQNVLPPHTIIWGYSRSNLTHESLRQQLKPFLAQQHQLQEFPVSDPVSNSKKNHYNQLEQEDLLESFLNMCFYQIGSGYDDIDAFRIMNEFIVAQKEQQRKANINYLFYLAIPPNLFHTVTETITHEHSSYASVPRSCLKILFEKPFGRDTESYLQLSNSLSDLPGIDESQILRIDHYLGKDMVRAIPNLRFHNAWAKVVWNRHCISRVVISMKETIGTAGRGGYFDQYGIIRDIIQNHLLQVMTIVAMEEPPASVLSIEGGGPKDKEHIRDAKCRLLKDVRIPTLEDCTVGQYIGYKDDEQVPDDSCTPTFAVIRLFVDNDRWRGVPFILLAGKCLDEKSAEVRIVLKNGDVCSDRIGKRNELTIKIQPDHEISLTTHVSSHENNERPNHQQLMTLNLKTGSEKSHDLNNDDAYSKLIHDALKGNSSSFVRDDELRLSWEIFTPLLHQTEHIRPYAYKIGSQGPPQARKVLDNHDQIHARSRL